MCGERIEKTGSALLAHCNYLSLQALFEAVLADLKAGCLLGFPVNAKKAAQSLIDSGLIYYDLGVIAEDPACAGYYDLFFPDGWTAGDLKAALKKAIADGSN